MWFTLTSSNWSSGSSAASTTSCQTPTTGRRVMTAPDIALPANLNNEDDDGRNWALLRDAASPEDVVEGAVLTAGTEHFWSWVRIHHVDPDGQVHFEQIDADEARRRGADRRSA